MQNIINNYGVKMPAYIMLAVAWVCILIAVFFLLLVVFKISTPQSNKNRRKIAQNMTSKTNVLDDAAEKIAKWLEKKGIYKMNQYKKGKFQAEFNGLEIKKTPEEHLIGSILRGVVFSLLAPLFALAIIVLGKPNFAIIGVIVGLLFGVLIGLSNYNSVDRIMASRRDKIEKELPRFVSVIEQNLKFDDNLPEIIEEYTKNSDTPLCKELNKALADIKTGDYENAMAKMSARVNSGVFSEVARGLSSALRGEETAGYFETLSIKLKEQQAMILEKERLKLPKRTKFLVWAMLASMFLLYAVVLVVSVMDNLAVFKDF